MQTTNGQMFPAMEIMLGSIRSCGPHYVCILHVYYDADVLEDTQVGVQMVNAIGTARENGDAMLRDVHYWYGGGGSANDENFFSYPPGRMQRYGLQSPLNICIGVYTRWNTNIWSKCLSAIH